jgi:hypothetical protein
MSAAPIIPAHIQPSVAWDGAFTPDELDRIEAYGDALAHSAVLVHDADAAGSYGSKRISRTAWIEQEGDAAWIYERLTKVAQALNVKAYQFDLRGFSDNFNYTIYHATEGGRP